MIRIITFGTFDLFHEGHYNILKRAKNMGNYLIVGVSSDELSLNKGKSTEWDVKKRIAHIKSLNIADYVFIEESLQLKNEYIKQYDAHILVMGNDWEGAFDWVNIPCVYYARTTNISTSVLKIMQNNTKHTYLFFDIDDNPKHLEYYNVMSKLFDKYGIRYYKYSNTDFNDGINHKQCMAHIDEIDIVIQFNIIHNIINIYFYDKIKDKICILIDHGTSNTKWFLSDVERYNAFDYFIVAGQEHKKSMEAFFGPNNNIMSSGFIKASSLYMPSKITRNELCQKYGLDTNKLIVLYCPTWFMESDEVMIRDHSDVIKQLCEYGNYIISFHPLNKNNKLNSNKIIRDVETSEIIKIVDIVVSDNSSMLNESLVINKKTIQMLMSQYSDNPAINYDLPLTAGTCNHYIGGIVTRSNELLSTIYNINKIPQHIFDIITFNVKHSTYLLEDAHEKVLFELMKINDKPAHKKNKRYSRNMNHQYYKQKMYIGFADTKNDVDELVKRAYYYIKISSIVPFVSNVQYIMDYNKISIEHAKKNNIILIIQTLDDYQTLEVINYPHCMFMINMYSIRTLSIMKYICYAKVPVMGVILNCNVTQYVLCALQSFGKTIFCSPLFHNIGPSLGYISNNYNLTEYTNKYLISMVCNVYQAVLQRLPQKNELLDIFYIKEFVCNHNYLTSKIQASKRNLWIVPEITNIDDLLLFMKELCTLHILPISVNMVSYQPNINDYIYDDDVECIDIYKCLRKAYITWKYLTMILDNHEHIIEIIYLISLNRKPTSDEIHYYTNNIIELVNITGSDEYKLRYKHDMIDTWNNDKISVTCSSNIIKRC
jgi:glycerol-3-phosphate cytidylyltransferase